RGLGCRRRAGGRRHPGRRRRGGLWTGPVGSGWGRCRLSGGAARDLAPKPVTLDHSRSAALPLSALTAWQAFTEQANVRPGNHVLVHGGAGGVGAFAVQIAKALGARVTATASAGDIGFVRSLRADVVIDYKATPFEEVVS